jgi:putative peptidoglycan lipid II flippase
VSVVTAMLPALSRVAHAGALRQVGSDVAATMRLVAVLIVPVAAVLIVNGASVAILLFGYGAATPDQAGLMGLIVSVFMLGLLPFTLFYVLLRGYYALEDTRTPFWITVFFTVVLLATVYPLFHLVSDGGAQVAGIAGGYAISYWVGFVVAWWVLARRVGFLDTRRTTWSLARMLAAGILAVGAMYAVLHTFLTPFAADGFQGRLPLVANVVVTSIVGLGVYVLAAWAMRVTEVAHVLSTARRLPRRLTGRGRG